MKLTKLIYFLSCALLMACSEYTPKPLGYPRIERGNAAPRSYENHRLSFLYSSDAEIQQLTSDTKQVLWFNIFYPAYNATIYCTYLPITESTFPKELDDSYRLAYSHASKAEGIDQLQFVNAEHRTSAVVYNIRGQVAVPVQFFVTDSVSNFFRGSLYYSQVMNTDSIAPITRFLTEDIISLIESLQWKNAKK